jgi:hypothetical protein
LAQTYRYRAAEQGSEVAQSNLALMHKIGVGVPQNFIDAQMWYILSASMGMPDAAEQRDQIAAKMTTADISEAQRRAKVCLASNYKDCK